MAISSAAGACLSFLVGGLDLSLKSLFVLIVVDYLTGLYAAWKHKIIGSKRGARGLASKAANVAVVVFCTQIDNGLAQGHLFRTAAIFGYTVLEAISICENIDRLGYGEFIPEPIRARLVQIREEKGGGFGDFVKK